MVAPPYRAIVGDFKPFGLAVPKYEKLGIPGPYFGDAVWEHLQKLDEHGLFQYIPIKVNPFPDGAEKVIVNENVRDKVVYVVHLLYTLPARHVLLGAQFCDSIVRSDSAEVHLFDLFNPYFRQEKRRDREPITAALVAILYHASGMEALYTVDPHTPAVAGFFKKLEPLPMTRRLAKRVMQAYDLSNAVVASADGGGEDRAGSFASLLGLPLINIHKERVDGSNTRVKDVLGDVKGKNVFLRDDIVSTAGTTVTDANALRERGARRIYNVATHLELCGPAMQRLMEHDVHVIGTNTIPKTLSDEEMRYVDVVPVEDIIAKVIYTKATGGSLRGFFSETD